MLSERKTDTWDNGKMRVASCTCMYWYWSNVTSTCAMYLLVSDTKMSIIMSTVKVLSDAIITRNDIISTLIIIVVTSFRTKPLLEIMANNNWYQLLIRLSSLHVCVSNYFNDWVSRFHYLPLLTAKLINLQIFIITINLVSFLYKSPNYKYLRKTSKHHCDCVNIITCTYMYCVYYNFRLDYRVGEWDPDFRKYLKTLDEKKPVVLCGDLNVAHHEIGREI